jgi:hypothetical protein
MKPRRPRESKVGSGQSEIPWLRMHSANLRRPRRIRGISDRGYQAPTPGGSRYRQALAADQSREPLAPYPGSFAGGSLISVWPGSGSGNCNTPWERMQWEKASSDWGLDDGGLEDPPALGEPPEPPHAVRARVVVAMMAATAVRTMAPMPAAAPVWGEHYRSA